VEFGNSVYIAGNLSLGSAAQDFLLSVDGSGNVTLDSEPGATMSFTDFSEYNFGVGPIKVDVIKSASDSDAIDITTQSLLEGPWNTTNNATAGTHIVNYQTMTNQNYADKDLYNVFATSNRFDGIVRIGDSGGYLQPEAGGAVMVKDSNNALALKVEGAPGGYARRLYEEGGNPVVTIDDTFQLNAPGGVVWRSEGTATSLLEIVNYQTMTNYVAGVGAKIEQSMQGNSQSFTGAGGYEAITNWSENVTDTGYTFAHSNATVSTTARYTVGINASYETGAAESLDCRFYTNGVAAVDNAGKNIGWQRDTSSSLASGVVTASRTLDIAAGTVCEWRIDAASDADVTWNYAEARITKDN
jgi:hypothetical protein